MARLPDDPTRRRLARIPSRGRETPALRDRLREVSRLGEQRLAAVHESYGAGREAERQEAVLVAARAAALRSGEEDPGVAETEAAIAAARAREREAQERAAALEVAHESAEDDAARLLDQRASAWARDAARQREPLARKAQEALDAAEQAVAELADLDSARRFMADWPDLADAKGAYVSAATIPALTNREGFPMPAASAFAALRAAIDSGPLPAPSPARRVQDLVRPIRGSRVGG